MMAVAHLHLGGSDATAASTYKYTIRRELGLDRHLEIGPITERAERHSTQGLRREIIGGYGTLVSGAIQGPVYLILNTITILVNSHRAKDYSTRVTDISERGPKGADKGAGRIKLPDIAIKLDPRRRGCQLHYRPALEGSLH